MFKNRTQYAFTNKLIFTVLVTVFFSKPLSVKFDMMLKGKLNTITLKHPQAICHIGGIIRSSKCYCKYLLIYSRLRRGNWFETPLQISAVVPKRKESDESNEKTVEGVTLPRGRVSRRSQTVKGF